LPEGQEQWLSWGIHLPISQLIGLVHRARRDVAQDRREGAGERHAALHLLPQENVTVVHRADNWVEVQWASVK
jgi:hypothetical protein